MNKEQLAARLLPTFLGELEQQVRALHAELLALEGQPTSAEHLKTVFRIAHSLKGASQAVGVSPLEYACQALETLLAQARDGTRLLGPDDFALLFQATDALSDAEQRLKAGRELSPSPLAELRGALGRWQADASRGSHRGGNDASTHPRG